MYNLRMKLICLNLWGGTLLEKTLEFIKVNSLDTDIFCFQEIYTSPENKKTPSDYQSNLLEKISEVLPNFDHHFSPQFHDRDFHFPVDYKLSQGIVIFWKKSLNAIDKGEIFVYSEENKYSNVPGKNQIIPPRNLQYVEFDNLIVSNIHGYWAPLPKYDTPERIKQSELIINFLNKYEKSKIIAGDFNLRIDTESISMIENAGFNNLVKESNAKTTRSSLYDIQWRKNDKFADYIFTSNDLKVSNFKVMDDEISDHLPLLVEFDV